MTVLKKDSSIHFPHLEVLKASAGSGKTHALSKRFVQFIFSPNIPNNSLQNILAVTFSNNAAKEMKERILKWLKLINLNSEDAEEIIQLISLNKKEASEKAGKLIDRILDNYSDFQVKTIDSFITSVFKASSIDFGFNPDFEILMKNNTLFEYSFNLFLKNVREGSSDEALLEEIICMIQEQKGGATSYIWDPAEGILKVIKNMYGKFASTWKEPKVEDFSSEMSALQDKLRAVVNNIEDLIEKSGLERHGSSKYKTICNAVINGKFADIVGQRGENLPVKKPDKKKLHLQDPYNQIIALWNETSKLVRQYTSFYARSYYHPYIKVYNEFTDTLESVKKHQGMIFIEDLSRKLAKYLNEEKAPDVYFRIGETIYHFLIDEFQDTSPIQWKNLFPLLENSLSQKGSLFVVGDTKQAIYGFRNADYKIMKDIEARNPFPSAGYDVGELDINYRSKQRILEFNEKVFKENVKNNKKYSEAGEKSGLIDYCQNVKEENKNGGYAEIVICKKDDEDPNERQKIQELIKGLMERGYKNKDIAILASKNKDVVKVTGWLNEIGMPFISHSSLDIRKRKITAEVVSLLNFLDSPMDDLSFAEFILGDIFSKMVGIHYPEVKREQLKDFLFKYRGSSPLYKSFQEEFEVIWNKYFADLFKASGYLPLYDLVAGVFNTFRLFDIFEDEEASLIKILEVIKEFEGEGRNTIRDFLEFTGDSEADESKWNINAPKDADAVNVMTVHKAKGLEFAVVIMLLYERTKGKNSNFIINEQEDSIELLRITKEILKSDTQLEEISREEETKELVNSLNSLYVGFTRAKEELYVIGVRGEEDAFPIDLLPANEYAASEKPLEASHEDKPSAEHIKISHYHQGLVQEAGIEKDLNIREKQRGEFIHRVLSNINYLHDDLENEIIGIIKNANKEAGTGYPEAEIKNTVVNIIKHKDVSEYFIQKPDREIKKEQEFSDENGGLFRMDRVVIDKGKAVVIDYKTGMDKEAEGKYISQIKAYLKILKEIYHNKDIEGLIVYVDIKEVRRVS
ncbi:MAG: UvrD-helicase domain-containing protein [Nitrospirae bacterium]|nr:UvrD-helicase domain-containing protein [Nitrospirota bacterium]